MNKHETHIEGVKYAAEYLLDRNINTKICKDGRKIYLKIIDGKSEGKIIGIGALQEHDSYLMSKTSDSTRYESIIIVTGIRYNIKRVFPMAEEEARTLANEAIHGDEKKW